MIIDTFDAILRLLIIVASFAAFVVVMLVRWTVRREVRDGESLRMLGGAFLCLAVSTGTLGVLLDWPTFWRLPFSALAVNWVLAGSIREYIVLRKRRNDAGN